MQEIRETRQANFSGSGAKKLRFCHTGDIVFLKGLVDGMKSQNVFKWKHYEAEIIFSQ
jgi:hypothetical protein